MVSRKISLTQQNREVNGMSREDTFMEFVQEKFDRKLKEEMETESEEVLPIYNVIMQNPGKTFEEICELVVG